MKKRLTLKKVTLRDLEQGDLSAVRGGSDGGTCPSSFVYECSTNVCPSGCESVCCCTRGGACDASAYTYCSCLTPSACV